MLIKKGSEVFHSSKIKVNISEEWNLPVRDTRIRLLDERDEMIETKVIESSRLEKWDQSAGGGQVLTWTERHSVSSETEEYWLTVLLDQSQQDST